MTIRLQPVDQADQQVKDVIGSTTYVNIDTQQEYDPDVPPEVEDLEEDDT